VVFEISAPMTLSICRHCCRDIGTSRYHRIVGGASPVLSKKSHGSGAPRKCGQSRSWGTECNPEVMRCEKKSSLECERALRARRPDPSSASGVFQWLDRSFQKPVRRVMGKPAIRLRRNSRVKVF
jgi:hypothetical protein